MSKDPLRNYDANNYALLTLVALDTDTEIYIADLGGHFVQKGSGRLETSLLKGAYVIHFTMQGEKRVITLTEPLEVSENPPILSDNKHKAEK